MIALAIALLEEFELPLFKAVVAQLQTFLIVTSVFVGIILWDFTTVIVEEARFIFIPELKRCWIKRKRPGLPTISLLALRLICVPMVAVLLTCLTSSSLSDSQRVTMTKVYLYLQTCGTLFACAIFVVRTVAIRDSKLPMKIFLWLYLFGLIGFEFSSVATAQVPYDLYSIDAFIKAGGADAEGLLNQGIDQMLHAYTIVLGLLIGFDTTVFVLCLETRISKFRWISSQSRIARTFYLDAFWFFGVTTSVTVLELVWVWTHRHSRLCIALIIPIQAWVTLSISPRVIRRLKLHAARHESETSTNGTSTNRIEPSRSFCANSPDSSKTQFPRSIHSPVLAHRALLPRSAAEDVGELPFHSTASVLVCDPPRTLQKENILPMHTSRTGTS